ncbi:MAG: ABC transporter ATP-binding protein/permease [Nitrospirales bacterium]|nr:ABC transporter ATP-binding protein [Nitrospira sp.]MDR4503126.1 ABC transporter ATP-binding protein/permease [Nitrospirales bacterium]
MSLLLAFGRAYPWASFLTLLSLLIAGIMEGLSLSTLLPLLSTAINSQSSQSSGGGQGQVATEAGPGQLILDGLTRMGFSPSLGALLVVIVFGILLKNVFLLLANRQVGYTMAHVATDQRLALLRALLNTKWEYYVRQPAGTLVNAVATEAQRSASAYHFAANVTAVSIQVFVYTCVAFLVSWKVTLTAISASLCLLFVLNKLIRIAKRAGRRQTKLLKSLLSVMTDSLRSVKPLKAMAREALFSSLLESETKKLNKAIRRQVMSREALRASQEPMLTILVAIGLYVALVKWEMPFATVMVLVLLLAQMLSRLGKVQRQYQEMVVFESAYWSLRDTIEQAERARENTSGIQTPTLDDCLRVEHVTFAYDKRTIFEDLSLTIPAGYFTSIVGPSGVGKTTVVDLAIGLIRPQRGEVLLDDQPLSQIDLRAWRKMIGYVPQETLLLHDSVYRNVTLGDPDLQDQDVEYALRAAGAWAFVQDLPEGAHSSVGEHGSRLSGGQRQRIAIARALAQRPKLLILDEATSALDSETEAAICQTLRDLRGGMTILAISHQTGLIEAADRVYRLEHGAAAIVVDRSSAEPRSSPL